MTIAGVQFDLKAQPSSFYTLFQQLPLTLHTHTHTHVPAPAQERGAAVHPFTETSHV